MSALRAIGDRLEPPSPVSSGALWDAIGDDLEDLLALLAEGDSERIGEYMPWIERAVVAASDGARVPASDAERAELRIKVERAMDLARQAQTVAAACAGMLTEVLGCFHHADLPPGTLFQG